MNDGKIHGCRCRNCGIELITQNKSADTFCRFCGAPALVAADYENTSIPELALPFEINKAQAGNMFLRYLSARPLAASIFSQKVKRGQFSALYLPVCLSDIDITTQVTAQTVDGQNLSSRVLSTAKSAHASLSNVLDTFNFMNLGEYDFSKAVAYSSEMSEIPFEKPAVYSDEKHLLDLPIEEIETQAIQTGIDSIGGREKARKNLKTQITHQSFLTKQVLVPVWILSHTANGYTQQIIINAQNGEIRGEPQISLSRIAAIFGGIAAGCAVVGELIWITVNAL